MKINLESRIIMRRKSNYPKSFYFKINTYECPMNTILKFQIY